MNEDNLYSGKVQSLPPNDSAERFISAESYFFETIKFFKT